MGLFQLVRSPLLQAMSNVAKNASAMTDLKNAVAGTVGIVQNSWIGGDEQAYSEEIQTVVVPMVAAFVASLANINLGTTKAIDTMDKADSQAKGLMSEVTDDFQSI